MHLMLRRMDPALFEEIAEEEGRLENELFRRDDDEELSDAYDDEEEMPDYGSDDEEEEEEPPEDVVDEISSRLGGPRGDDSRDDDPEFLSLGMLYDGLHFLISGEPYTEEVESALECALAGGEESDIEGPQGMVRVISAADVREIATALQDLDDAAVHRRASAEELEVCAELPEEGWTPAICQRLLQLLEDLREFYDEASTASECVLAWFE